MYYNYKYKFIIIVTKNINLRELSTAFQACVYDASIIFNIIRIIHIIGTGKYKAFCQHNRWHNLESILSNANF